MGMFPFSPFRKTIKRELLYVPTTNGIFSQISGTKLGAAIVHNIQ